MSDFTTIESAVMQEFANLTEYFSHDWQVSRDDSVLQRGADYFAIFKSGNAFNEMVWSTFDLQVDYILNVDVQTRFSKNIDETKHKQSELVNEISAMIRSYGFLKNTAGVLDSRHTVGEIQYLYLENNPQPAFAMNSISITISTMTEREDA